VDKETPRDKLLEACSEPKVVVPSGQEEIDKTCRRLDSYVRNELSAQLTKAVENVARNEIAGSLRPLNDSVHTAASRIESCSESLAGISWNGRLMMLAVLLGVSTVSVGACMVRWTFFDDRIDEAKRYEVYGRKVEANIERYKPKDKEKLYRCIGGRP
jgi:hypothetical protein